MGKTRAFTFDKGKVSKVSIDEVVRLRGKAGTMTWVDIEDPTRKELQSIGKKFKFHHLAIEDASNTNQRCKVEEYEGFAFIVLHVFPKGECMEQTQLNLFLDGNLLVTAHFKCVEAIDEVAKTVEENPSILERGPDFLAYQIMDLAVDSLFPHLDEVETGIDDFEDRMLKATSPEQITATLGGLFDLKRRNLAIRKIAWPMRDVLTVFSHRDSKYVRPENTVYFRDVYDHMLRITDMTEMNREVLSASMEAYLAVISNNLNVAMKKLAALAGIFAVPMLISSIYGMNFHVMPELDDLYGFYVAVCVMLLGAVLTFAFFRINKWI